MTKAVTTIVPKRSELGTNFHDQNGMIVATSTEFFIDPDGDDVPWIPRPRKPSFVPMPFCTTSSRSYPRTVSAPGSMPVPDDL